MARVTQPAEVNSFVAGLITEASPLTFPDNASVDEENFVLLKNGSRQRRLGMDYEDGFQLRFANTSGDIEPAISAYTWRNAGNVADSIVQVVQVGQGLYFYDGTELPISANYITGYSFPEQGTLKLQMDYAVVDGKLVVVFGGTTVKVFDYTNGVISLTEDRIKIRDLFGVAFSFDGEDLTEGSNVELRVDSVAPEHVYNLRNQTWAVPRLEFEDYTGGDDTFLKDPIRQFREYTTLTITEVASPSYADQVNNALYPDPNNTANRTAERFHPADLYINPTGSFLAPRGYFIIDALERGTSRAEELDKLHRRYPNLFYFNPSLPEDRTPFGASCVASYAGRAWFGGFSGNTVGGDERSPEISSYLMFSQLANTTKDIFKCYQAADPTSFIDSNLVATDGGFLRIDGAYGIVKLIDIGSALIVIASNGVWKVTGGSDYGFTATDYLVTKISEHGTDYAQSVVVADNTVLFWGDDAIYHITPNEFGDIVANNLTNTTIQTLYDSIDKRGVFGFYDTYDRKVRWLYNNRISNAGLAPTELILDLNLGAFSKSQLAGTTHRPLAMIAIPPFSLTNLLDPITVNGEEVTVNGQLVGISKRARTPATRETAYVTFSDGGETGVNYSFAIYQRNDYRDFGEEDAKAYMVTGYMNGGDFQRYKQVPYITFYLNKTEDGYTADEFGDLWPSHESGCIVQSQWEWTNSANSNRWGRPIQVYRPKRYYIPENTNDNYDDGNSVVVTKNKLRGKGRVLSLLIETEEEKDCQLLGWSMVLTMNRNV